VKLKTILSNHPTTTNTDTDTTTITAPEATTQPISLNYNHDLVDSTPIESNITEAPIENIRTITDIPGNNEPTMTRYGCRIKPTAKYQAYKQQLTANTTIVSNYIDYNEEDKTKYLDDPILLAQKSSTDPDTLYLHKALKAPDSSKLKEAMLEEINQHIKKRNWEPMLKSNLPPNTIIIPTVWAMRRKRRIHNQEVYKWKSRLNLGGH
jgi:hypothetical protein